MREDGVRNPSCGLTNLGFHCASARYNASEPVLLEDSIRRNEGVLSRDGALIVRTGKFTGRSPKDKHIVREPGSEADIWWDGNREMSPAAFNRLKDDIFSYLADKHVEVQDLVGGADPAYSVNVRLIAEYTWHALFLRHLLRRPDPATLATYVPEYTIVNAPGFRADPERHGCRTDTVVAIDFSQKLILIGGTQYAGENKKSVFTILNHIYPERGVMPMHCSANHAHGDPSDAAIFFGLSGTGKTTLSSDPERILIGDDEHGWSDQGVFNFEGGCYAKTINLSQKAEPEIWHATHHAGTVLENVGYDPVARTLDLADGSLTENTRAAYPLDILNNVSPESRGGTPRHVFLLTCDAYGVTPPIGLLTPEQARALFLLGFTSKVAGTERGVTEPEPTFSTCFGAPFLTRRPEVYAELFEKRIASSGAQVWLLNTGWTGGGTADGKRMPIAVTRALLNAALAGRLDTRKVGVDPVWGMAVPSGVPAEAEGYMNPRSTWSDPAAFDRAAAALRKMLDERLEKLSLANPPYVPA
ncbi:phosphoenolpyruvate carboxykinase (ATP) [Acuticoccus sediminis]|uniref:Phosphoenolpyruvate carboxykinase (ATP) n=1 Tax=Acuticoccus sediminis TaxID=2184697 RepID=A0A8B2NWK3_9HYPH|nr:phosphoenolpyruvate carboxykinase (ATP) [Acuticoccus sediminis]RAI00077.1 phosphoenolpyruvate carboxykinase (ATP) [Acuticoccus sediminis]